MKMGCHNTGVMGDLLNKRFPITLELLLKVCHLLECNIDDICPMEAKELRKLLRETD